VQDDRQVETDHCRASSEDVEVDVGRRPRLDAPELRVRDPGCGSDRPEAQPGITSSVGQVVPAPTDRGTRAGRTSLPGRQI